MPMIGPSKKVYKVAKAKKTRDKFGYQGGGKFLSHRKTACKRRYSRCPNPRRPIFDAESGFLPSHLAAGSVGVLRRWTEP
jgi:hypothetical protein